MEFIIQREEERMSLDLESLILKQEIDRFKMMHSYREVRLAELDSIKIREEEIPVGTIEFVTKALNRQVGFIKENPIEIPKYLRTEEFLKRDYRLLRGYEIPREGTYFLKDATTLKNFTYCGNLAYIISDSIFDEQKENDYSVRLDRDSIYVLSSDYKPISEYRVYVFNNEIQGIVNYDGDATVFPDVKLIKKAVLEISMHEKYLKSYTIDVMINKKNETALIEIHNFTSCGVYSTVLGQDIVYAYRDGIDYLKKDNKEIEV